MTLRSFVLAGLLAMGGSAAAQPLVERGQLVGLAERGVPGRPKDCEESRDGAHAMDGDAFAALFSTVRSTDSEIDKRGMIASAAGGAYLTAQQLMQLLDLFRGEEVKLEVVRAVVAHVIDPRRAVAYGPRLRSSLDREQPVALLTRPQKPSPSNPPRGPVPVPEHRPEHGPEHRPAHPATQCPRQPACGLACPGGRMAKDANGCGLCACEK